MSMIVKNNLSAQMALGELNKNVNKAGQLLSKIASGEKISGAKDNASDYAISEKMREQIRSLTQDNQNVQNGSSLFKIASGGIENIVEELRNLKELAINAANDTNTDTDRLTSQKVGNQYQAYSISEFYALPIGTIVSTSPFSNLGTYADAKVVYKPGAGNKKL